MPRNLRENWNRKDTPRDHKALRDNAEKAVRERDEEVFKRLKESQAMEIGQLHAERAYLHRAQALDRKPEFDKEIQAINDRHDRRTRDLQRRHNSFWGKMFRAIGGYAIQKKQLRRVERERFREVSGRQARQERDDRLRQKSLSQRLGRVESDIASANEHHAQARDEFRQRREKGFEHAVRQEMSRARGINRGRSI